MRWKAMRNGNPQTFHIQFSQLLRPEEQTVPTLSPPLGDAFGLLPWKVAMLLLPKADFAMGLEADKTPGVEQHGDQKEDAIAKPSVMSKGLTSEPATAVVEGSNFLKWGRNLKAKTRFVFFDESADAIVWKNLHSDKTPIGAIPLSKVQDICVGLQTPILQKAWSKEKKVRSPKLRDDHVLSIIATDRTLDLQAESAAEMQRWVAGLKAQYRRFVQQQGPDGEAQLASLPKVLEKKCKTYPTKWRSDNCALRTTYKKLQAVTALGRTLRASRDSGKGKAQALGRVSHA